MRFGVDTLLLSYAFPQRLLGTYGDADVRLLSLEGVGDVSSFIILDLFIRLELPVLVGENRRSKILFLWLKTRLPGFSPVRTRKGLYVMLSVSGDGYTAQLEKIK